LQNSTYDALEAHQGRDFSEVGHSIGGAIAMGALGRLVHGFEAED